MYRVAYSVIGRNKKPLTSVRACVIAMDVADLTDEIRKLVLGAEITSTGEDGQITFHEVAEAVEIESAELIGRLHGITDTAYQIVHRCDGQEHQ